MGHPDGEGDRSEQVLHSPGGGGGRKRHHGDLRTLFSTLRVSSFSQSQSTASVSVGGGGGGGGGAAAPPPLTRAASFAAPAPAPTIAGRWREARAQDESSPPSSPPGRADFSRAATATATATAGGPQPDLAEEGDEEEDPEEVASRVADALRDSLRLGADDGVDDDMYAEMARAMIDCKIRNTDATATASGGGGSGGGGEGAGAGDARARVPTAVAGGGRGGLDPTVAARAEGGRRRMQTGGGGAGDVPPSPSSAFTSARRLDADFDDDDGEVVGSSTSSDEWVQVEEEISGRSGEAASMVREDLARARMQMGRIHLSSGGDGDRGGASDASGGGGGRGDDSNAAPGEPGGRPAPSSSSRGLGQNSDGATTADAAAAAAGATTTTPGTPSARVRRAEPVRPSFFNVACAPPPPPPDDDVDELESEFPESEDELEEQRNLYLASSGASSSGDGVGGGVVKRNDGGGGGDVDVGGGRGGGAGSGGMGGVSFAPASAAAAASTAHGEATAFGVGGIGGCTVGGPPGRAGSFGVAAAAAAATAAAKTTATSTTTTSTTPHPRVVRFADARCGEGGGVGGGGDRDSVGIGAAATPGPSVGTRGGGLGGGGAAGAGAAATPAAAATAAGATTTPAAAAATTPRFLDVDPSEMKFDFGLNFTPKNGASATPGVRGGATPHTVTKAGKVRRKASPRVAVQPRATTPTTAFKFAFVAPQPPPPPPAAGAGTGAGVAPPHATNGNFGANSAGGGMASGPSAPFAAAVGGGNTANVPVQTSNGAAATATTTAPSFPFAAYPPPPPEPAAYPPPPQPAAYPPPPPVATAAPPPPVPGFGFTVDLRSSAAGNARRRGSVRQQRKSSFVRATSSGSAGSGTAGHVGNGHRGGHAPPPPSPGAAAAAASAAAAAAAQPSIPGFSVDLKTGRRGARYRAPSFVRATSSGSAGSGQTGEAWNGHGGQASSAAAASTGLPGGHFPQQPHPPQQHHPLQSQAHPLQSQPPQQSQPPHLQPQQQPQPPPPQQHPQHRSHHEAANNNIFSPMSIGSCGGGDSAAKGAPLFTVGVSPSRSSQRKRAPGGKKGRSASFHHRRTAVGGGVPANQQRRSDTAATMRGAAAAATANADLDRPGEAPAAPVPREIFTHGVPTTTSANATASATGQGREANGGGVEGSAASAGAAAAAAAEPPASAAAAAADYTVRSARATSLREEARNHYTSGEYRSSVTTYTQAIAAVAGGPPPRDDGMLAVLHGNRGAALMMVGAYRVAAAECRVALSMVDATLRRGQRLSPDSGATQASKLYCRMGRAHLKSGQIGDASRAFSTAVDMAERARRYLREGFVEDDGRGKAAQVLGHTVNDATLGLAEIVRCKEAMRSTTMPFIRTNQVLHHLDKVLEVCPGSTEFRDRKITTLVSLKKWPDVALTCERLACDMLRYEGVFVGDLQSMDPFARLSPATHLNADYFRDKSSARSVPLGAKEAAEAVVRLPSSLQPVYLRALRLEERYAEASEASRTLEMFAGTSSPRYGIRERFAWIQGEKEKLRRTTSTKERGDRNFRKGEYARAVDNYTVCLSVDSEKETTPEENAGGRLHAVLYCNRAACFMALGKHGAAAKDCTAALHVQPFYMKATLRRGRCLARTKRFEASITDYKKWIDFVSKPDAAKRAFDFTSEIPPEEVDKVKEELANVKQSMRDSAEKQRAEAQAREDHRRWHKENFPRHRWNTSGTGSPHQRKHGSHHHDNGSRAEGRRDARDRSGSRNDGQDQRGTNHHVDESANHYTVLQVRRTCSPADIKKAYRKMALRFHPDKNKDPNAADIFRRVNEAYNVLSDRNSRRVYDVSLRLGRH